MKASVLMATQEKDVWRRVRKEVADLCTIEVSATTAGTCETLLRKAFDIIIVDCKLPHFDSVEFVHALRHAPASDTFVVTWGRVHPDVYFAHPKTWESVMIPRSIASVVELVRARLDPAAARTLRAVRYQPNENTFFVVFKNGKTYELPRDVIEEDDGTTIVGEPAVIHGGEAFQVRLKSGRTYEVAWDFVLYHQEPTYPYHKGKAEQQRAEVRRAERIAARIRQEREARGWSLGELARRTDIQPPNLSRLESGKHVPSLETLERVADALGVRLVDLVGT